MGYTPVELRHVKVGRSLFGYDRRRVEELLDEVADSFEAVWRDRGELADQTEELQRQLAELREREQLLTQTLVAAEQTAVDVRDQARREAELILTEAHHEARSVARNAQGERDRLVTEARRIEGFLRAALGLLEESARTAAEHAPLPAEPLPPAPAPIEPALPAVESQPAAEPVWPREEHTETVEEALGLDTEPSPPFLRRVVGGEGRDFDWGD
jgi:cell division initiation protein